MSIQIIECARMHPPIPAGWQVGAPCLVIEADHGLVLVDCGLGLHDHESPSRRVRLYERIFGCRMDSDDAAVRQLPRRGYAPGDVRDIVQTHLHFDHAGGLPDFPQAGVHVHRREYEAMRRPRGWMELAYDRDDFVHGPNWVLYEQPTADWFGFEAIRLPFQPEAYLIPLFGHTRGHCGVAVRDGEGWLFQCADALPVQAEFERTPAWLNRLVLGPHGPRLQAWAAGHPEVRLLAGHMWASSFEAPETRLGHIS